VDKYRLTVTFIKKKKKRKKVTWYLSVVEGGMYLVKLVEVRASWSNITVIKINKMRWSRTSIIKNHLLFLHLLDLILRDIDFIKSRRPLCIISILL